MSNIFINLSSTDSTNDTISNLKLSSQRCLNTNLSIRIIKSFSNVFDIIKGKFGIFSTLTNHILSIIFMRSDKQMIRINAGRSITRMTNKMSFRNNFISKMNDTKLMSRDSCSLTAKPGISFIKGFCPNPASIRLDIYKRFKSFDVLLNSSWWRHIAIIQQNTKLPNGNLLKGI